MKKGFTLVELSIVLVIIGLLIGGILAAQSMIESAQINGVVKQISQYDIAMTNFKTKYDSLPGDSTKFPGSGGDGNMIYSWGNRNEGSFAWYHLSLGVGLKNYKNSDYIPYDWATEIPQEANCPRFKIDQSTVGSNCLFMNYGDWGDGRGDRNYYQYDSFTGVGGVVQRRVFKNKIMYAIDLKLDNGLPNGRISGGSDCNGASYDISDSTYKCELSIEIGVVATIN